MAPSPRFILILLLLPFLAEAQVTIPDHRRTDWHLAGNTQPVTASDNVISILDFGGDPTGTASCNTAYTAAIVSLGGGAGTILFPEGEYLFNSGITVPDSVFIQGESTATVLRFEIPGNGDLIRITGSVDDQPLPFAMAASRGDHTITLEDASSLTEGDIIRLAMTDNDLVFSNWAYGTLGQVVEVTAIEGSTVTLADPLNTYYPMGRAPKAVRVEPVRAAGVECLSIVRDNVADAQTSNIYIRAAFNCVVRNVHSTFGAFAHVEVNVSTHVTVEGCYFNQAIGYGSGGRGYGVMLQETSSFNHVQNNIMDHLRHSMIAQTGANGNVFSYNFSRDPYWTDVSLPANSAGDLVMHGNYAYMNLAEGNTVQHIVVDASHGTNGPMNTFFRNRAQLYGFFSDSGTPTDSLNLIGNETTNSGLFMGNFIVTGVGHINHGNNVRGTTTPAGTEDIGIESLLYPSGNYPSFMEDALPYIGYPLAMNANTTPANARYLSGTYVSCEAEEVTAIAPATHPTPTAWLHGHTLVVPATMLPAQLTVYAMDGRMLFHSTLSATSTPLTALPTGIYMFQLTGADGVAQRWKGAVGF
ncbi:MAG: T9SS type A sorting domain-containing protein [Flavobacteriales bacterium]|nr:T9SS type A sorting domain-containing protein [Flavobacteriales bacterium]